MPAQSFGKSSDSFCSDIELLRQSLITLGNMFNRHVDIQSSVGERTNAIHVPKCCTTWRDLSIQDPCGSTADTIVLGGPNIYPEEFDSSIKVASGD